MTFKAWQAMAITLVTAVLVLTCSEEPTDSLYSSNRDRGEAPQITNILPEDSALAGVRTLQILGSGFSPVPEENYVVFDEIVADVVQASENELIVKTPKIARPRINVRASVRSSELYSDSVFYKLNPAVAEYGTVNDGEILLAVAVNRAETVFMYILGKKLTKTRAGRPTETVNVQMAFEKVEALQFGPDDKLYAAVEAGRVKAIVIFDTTSGANSVYSSVVGGPRDFDFDENLYTWVGIDSSYTQGTTVIPAGNITSIAPNGASRQVVTSFDAPVSSVRVFNDNLFFTLRNPDSVDTAALYSASIDGSGGLSGITPLLSPAQSATLNKAGINDITISDDGKIYIGTSAKPDAVFEYDMVTQELNIHYPELIQPELLDFHWGTGLYLFAAQKTSATKSRALKIDMRAMGAPYFGRDQ